MPQPGMNGMEPAFGEAYGGHRGLLSPYPLAMSPQGGRTEYDQSVLLMLGSPASPRKRPFELLSDLVDDGGFGEDLHPERWDVSALDEMARYTKLGLGVGGELLACSEEAVLMGRWGRSREEQEEEEEERRRRKHPIKQFLKDSLDSLGLQPVRRLYEMMWMQSYLQCTSCVHHVFVLLHTLSLLRRPASLTIAAWTRLTLTQSLLRSRSSHVQLELRAPDDVSANHS